MENKGIKYKIYPTKEQEQQLLQEVGNCRFVWNQLLSKQIKFYRKNKKFKFYHFMASYLVGFKQGHKFILLSNAQVLQQVLKDLELAIKRCYQLGFGFPKFKKKGRNDSFRVPQHFTVGRGSITIPKVGQIKINKHCPLGGKAKHLTISRDREGKWYVSVCVEFKPKPLPKTMKAIGIDLGIKRLATGSGGQVKKSFKKVGGETRNGVKELERGVKTAQRELDRREPSSNNRAKTKHKLGKLHTKLGNKREDYLHKFSIMLVENFDLLVFEDLRTKNMAKSAKGTLESPGTNVKAKSGLNRSILREGWGRLVEMVGYKCRWYEKLRLKVNPYRSSQECSECGYWSKWNRRSQSKFECRRCGFTINADHNAARNILARGLRLVLVQNWAGA